MNSPSTAVAEPAPSSPAISSAPVARTRPFYWSVRRELWENRSIYIAPLIVAAVVLSGLLIAAMHLPHDLRGLHDVTIDPGRQDQLLAGAYGAAAVPITLTALVVGVFYCLGALHNERRDRSILFWKSLPVSDLVTVLSKASVPLVVLPLVTFAVIVVLRLAMLLLGSAILPAYGVSAATLWTHFPWLQLSLVPLYVVAVQTLWYAPVYGWLMLVSGWARRAPFLWAVLPPLAVALFEKIAFHTSYVSSMLSYRLTGSDSAAYDGDTGSNVVIHTLAQFDPAKFIGTPGLWVGLVFAAAFLAAAVWLRRYRDPV
jgi:ABC-2 type transport system permease protein